MEKTLTTINLSDFPEELHRYMENTEIYDSSCGENSQVLYSALGYYIKIAAKDSLARESAIADYFYKNGIGAEIVLYLSEDKDYMVTKPAPGMDATHFLDNPQKLCRTLAKTMKYLHSLPVKNHDISPSMDFYKDKSFNHDTLIHGDFCLPNIMLDNYDFKAFIDVGLAGAGDRHIDIFWCIWSLWFNLKTDKYTDYFLDLYGRDSIDMAKIKLIAKAEEKI